jgi:hypothetical protein
VEVISVSETTCFIFKVSELTLVKFSTSALPGAEGHVCRVSLANA